MGVYPPVVKSEGNPLSAAEIDRQLAAERLRVAAARKGWRGADLARRLGKSRQLVASWMRGDGLPTGAALVDLPGLLEVDAQWLFPKGGKTDVAGPGRPVGRRPTGKGIPLAASAAMLAQRISDIINQTLERHELTALNQAALIATMLEEMANFLQIHGVPKEGLKQMRDFAQDLVDGKFG